MTNYAPVQFTGNGVTAVRSLPWPYIAKEHVKALVNGVPATFTFDDISTIRFSTIPANGVAGLIYRETPDSDAVIFTTGQIESSKLTLASKLSLYRAGESVSNTQVLIGQLVTSATASAGAAATSATNAATSATGAATSATNAATDRVQAQAAATDAAAQAGTASSWATTAQGHAQAASTHAATAETHKNTAATSASGASSSLSNSQAIQTLVQGLYTTLLNNDFDSFYLTPKAADPTTRDGGAPLVGGEIFWNTTDSIWKRYNGTSWTTSLGGVVPVAKNGDTMLGLLTLSGDPTSALHAATKQYTDATALAGGTFTGKITAKASIAGGAGFRLAVGVDPTAPQDGDLWINAGNALSYRTGGATRTPVLTTSTNIYTAGSKQSFTGSAATAPARLVPQTAAPTTLENGDLWFNSTDNKAYARINGASVSFSVSGHVHTIAEVTSLQTTLDGKAALSHTHTITDVTGLQAAIDAKSDTSHTHAFSTITTKPTTLAGYGITDAGTNALGTRTVATTAPTGGANGDIWYQVS